MITPPPMPTPGPLQGLVVDLLEMIAEISPGGTRRIKLDQCGASAMHDTKRRDLSCGHDKAPWITGQDMFRPRSLIDRSLVDISAMLVTCIWRSGRSCRQNTGGRLSLPKAATHIELLEIHELTI
jgi:hypothetical protein